MASIIFLQSHGIRELPQARLNMRILAIIWAYALASWPEVWRLHVADTVFETQLLTG